MHKHASVLVDISLPSAGWFFSKEKYLCVRTWKLYMVPIFNLLVKQNPKAAGRNRTQLLLYPSRLFCLHHYEFPLASQDLNEQ